MGLEPPFIVNCGENDSMNCCLAFFVLCECHLDALMWSTCQGRAVGGGIR